LWGGGGIRLSVVKSIDTEVPRKTIRETINKDLEIIGLNKEYIALFDRCSRPHLVG